MSPRKVRLVVNVIRGLMAEKAEYELLFLQQKAARPVLKLLKSAVANAENNFQLKKDNLFIKKITVDEGPALKRWRPRAFGRAAMFKKRSSHVTIVLDELKQMAKPKKQRKPAKAAVKAKTSEPRQPSVEKRPVVSYDEIKHEAKGKGEKGALPEAQKKKSFISFKSIKERFTRRLGE